MEIAIFGTSADPPTLAHQQILTFLAEKYQLVAVYATDNPLKTHSSSLPHRQKMLELLIEDLKPLYPHIQHTPEISDRYTINTLELARRKWGASHDYTIVIGSDLIPQIFSWYQAQQLWPQVKVLIIPRANYPINPEHLKQLQGQTRGCNVASFSIPPFSSSHYRQHHLDDYLPQKIQQYIQQHHLYQSPQRG
ncbi:MAG: nicotinate-nucleotide adenylyltransferase [Geminocystis sp.]|nr:nicotinate-nucleotide adenylyltransferase [Geminocystis sp.]MCS7147169.1 nicotinate-nucleotide adenylyltransferase [Geminocystis sp.]MDW8116165.1 nicotinate-nucleotide adenylyltransferase [Geminocystis sp.]MDW8462843.1 nicotinate-nucleotide adenylyltransferase [Geminocystis sp.]